MKQLPLETPSFRYIQQSFKEWLDVLGYARYGVYGMPNCIRELLHWMEQHGTTSINAINNKQIRAYYQHLKMRPNRTQGGGLAAATLNKHLQAIHKFSDYLRQSGRLTLPKLNIPQEEIRDRNITVLTTTEIAQLYNLTEGHHEGTRLEPTAARDRAMLTIFYGCGLRRNEAYHLNVDDINFDRRIIHVRNGKNYKERLVPFKKSDREHLQEWIYDQRPKLVNDKKEEAFFISMMHRRMDGQSLLLRLKLLIQRSENITLQQKTVGLHTLRHSIATHLLDAGMRLENIAKFLGHSSLESTQIYTHLIEEEWDQNS